MINDGGDTPEVPGRISNMSGVTFLSVLRLHFVLFFFYVMGDVLYRWDSFTYYWASFSSFLPTFALVAIFWSCVSVVVSMLLWISGSTFERLSHWAGWKAGFEHYLVFVSVFCLSSAAAWTAKLHLVHRGTTFNEKITVLLSVLFVTFALSWLCRNKVKQWFQIIQKRITVLVNVLVIFIILSVIVVIFYSW